MAVKSDRISHGEGKGWKANMTEGWREIKTRTTVLYEVKFEGEVIFMNVYI